MPPKPRRKGPAHQNSFAYRHNPNSKKTKQILESPNVHVCRRCHEKIEWRKQYRKYKPRTQPGNCICCRLKRVTAAYHTICEPCTRTSAKARTLLDEWNNPNKQQLTEDAEKETVEQEEQEEGGETPTTEQSPEMEETSGAETQIELHQKEEPAKDPDKDDDDDPTSDEPRQRRVYRRVCAMCVKEPALPGESDEEDELDETFKHLDRPLKLRERKRLERMAEKKSNRRRTRPEEENEEHDEADQNQEGEEDNDDNNEEDNDPLLKAVGGTDRLLTGEAYQAKLLEQAAK